MKKLQTTIKQVGKELSYITLYKIGLKPQKSIIRINYHSI